VKALPHFLVLRGSLLLLLFTNIIGYAKASINSDRDPSCGKWIDESANFGTTQGIAVKPALQNSGNGCDGLFTLRDQLRYSLFLTPYPNDATVEFLPYGKSILIPGQDIEIKTTPVNIGNPAIVTLQGEINWKSVSVDASIWLLSSIVRLVSLPAGCYLPSSDQLLLLSFRLAPILESSVNSALKRDFKGAKMEFSRAIFAYIDKASNLGEGMAYDCLWAAAEKFFKKPLMLPKIAAEYIAWFGTTFYDYFKYQGPAVYTTVVLSYVAPPPLEPTIVPDTLDKNDLASVMRWMTYLMKHNEPMKIIPLIGSNGAKFAPYGMGVFPQGNNNGDEISGILEKTLSISEPICLGYDPNFGASPDKAIIYFRGLIMDIPELGITREGDIIGFQFFELENGWELFFITPIPDWEILDYQTLTPCPE
jgi:hypothetical protein